MTSHVFGQQEIWNSWIIGRETRGNIPSRIRSSGPLSRGFHLPPSPFPMWNSRTPLESLFITAACELSIRAGIMKSEDYVFGLSHTCSHILF